MRSPQQQFNRNRLLMLLLAPLLFWQGHRVKRNTVCLPEPAGDRSGCCGQGTPLRLLIIGDSSAAGVGVEHQQQALAGQLSQALQPYLSLQWQLLARSGWSTSTALLALQDLAQPVDVAVIVLGVNDVIGGSSPALFLRQQQALIERLRARCGNPQVILTAIPPLAQFPALPQPLASWLGRQASCCDTERRRWAGRQPDCHYLGWDDALDPAAMAQDGFHPGAPIYRHWAQRLAALITRIATANGSQSAVCRENTANPRDSVGSIATLSGT